MAAERMDAPRSRCRHAGWWLFLALVAGAFLTSYAFGWTDRLSFEELSRHHEQLRVWTWDHLPLALILFVCGYTVSASVPLPATIFHLAAGALLELWPGYVVVIAATNLAANAAFLLSRHLVGDFVQQRWGDRLRTVNRGIHRDGAYYLLTLRLVPAFPFFLINGLMGLTRIPLRTYAAVSFLGMLPVSFVYVYAGTQLSNIRSLADIISPGVLLAFLGLGLTPLLIRLLIPRVRPPARGCESMEAMGGGSGESPSAASETF
jgi:uncharacterized membrane protein YdjX (TVP38/TMEM64 family)